MEHSLPGCLLAWRFAVLNHSCQKACTQHAHVTTHTPACKLTHFCMFPEYRCIHHAHVHACMPLHLQTHYCMPDGNLSHWIIFSVVFITLSHYRFISSRFPVPPSNPSLLLFFTSYFLSSSPPSYFLSPVGLLASPVPPFPIPLSPSSPCLDVFPLIYNLEMIFKELLQPSMWGHSVSSLWSSHFSFARCSSFVPLLSPLHCTSLHLFFFLPLLLPSNLPSSSTLSPSIILLFFHLTLHFSPSLLPSISTSSGLIASHLIFASSLPPFDSSLSLFLFFLPNLCTSLLMLFTPAFTLAVSPLKYCWKRGQTGFLCCAFPCVFLHVSGVLSVGVCCEDVIRLTLFQAAESPAVCSLSN